MITTRPLAHRIDSTATPTWPCGDADLAGRWGHLTCRQAVLVAGGAGVRHLVLTHFSQRYRVPQELPEAFEREAREVFDGTLTVAADLDRVPVPPRRRP